MKLRTLNIHRRPFNIHSYRKKYCNKEIGNKDTKTNYRVKKDKIYSNDMQNIFLEYPH